MDGQQQPPNNNATIWHEEYDVSIPCCLKLTLCDADKSTYTTTELCQRLRASRYIIYGTEWVTICFDEDYSNALDSELEAVGNVLLSFPRFNRLSIYIRPATDKTVSLLLRNAPKEKIRQLHLAYSASRLSFNLSELEQRAWLASLRRFSLHCVLLDECDCRTLGRVLKQRQRGEAFHIDFDLVGFPSFAGFLVVADALFVSGPFFFKFFLNFVRDETIPSPFGSGSHGDFYKNFYERKEGNVRTRPRSRTGWTLSDTFEFLFMHSVFVRRCEPFDGAATELLARYSDFNRLQSTLLRTNTTATYQDWVDVLGHDDVRNNADFLFHLLRMNPGVYFGKDCCPKNNKWTTGWTLFLVTISCVTMLSFLFHFLSFGKPEVCFWGGVRP